MKNKRITDDILLIFLCVIVFVNIQIKVIFAPVKFCFSNL